MLRNYCPTIDASLGVGMVGGVKALYAVLLALVLGVGCGKALIDNPILEKTIRKQLNKPAGELTEADLRNVTRLDLSENKLTEMK